MTLPLHGIRSVRWLLFSNRPAPTFFYRIYDELTRWSWMKRPRWPLNNEQTVLRRPFFIIGSGRSGSTLLRAILASHSEISIPPESLVLGESIRHYLRTSYLPWPIVGSSVIMLFENHPEFHAWGIDLGAVHGTVHALAARDRNLSNVIELIYRQYIQAKKPAASIWGDKTPLNTAFLHWIDRLYPKARYIHMIRDGRDVVSSFLRTKLNTDVGVACDHWLSHVDRARSFGTRRAKARYLEVRYESLVSEPVSVIQAVSEFLGVNFQPPMLSFWKHAADLGDVPLYPYLAQVMRPITHERIGSWRQLPAEQLNYVQRRLGRMLRNLSYLS